MCALVEGTVAELADVLAGVQAELERDQRPSIPAVLGIVSLPEEAAEAVAALALADERMGRDGGAGPEPFDPGDAPRPDGRRFRRPSAA